MRIHYRAGLEQVVKGIAALCWMWMPCVLTAQPARADALRTARTHLTLSGGGTSARGLAFAELDGYIAHVAWSRAVRHSGRASWRLGAGGGSIFRNGYDPVCVLRSDVTCAPPLPSIYFASALAGVEFGGPAASVALHVGPTLYGASTTRTSAGGIGGEARAEAALRITRAFGVTAQGQLLGLPGFDDGTLTVRGVALGIRVSW